MENYTWLITGCSSGFGRAVAETSAEVGHQVIATARQPEKLQELADCFKDQVLIEKLDVTDNKQIKDVVSKGIEKFGKIDAVFNNAGYGLIGALEETSQEQMRAIFETNFFGAVNVIRTVLPHMREKGKGLFVNMSAKAGYDNYPGFGIYGATKFAMEGMTESLRMEAGHLGIKATMIEPGPFKTNFVGGSLKKGERQIKEYDKSVRKFHRVLQSLDGKQKGDPLRAAELIVRLVELDEVPARIPLGKYALDAWKKKLKSIEDEVNEWEAQSLATDYP